MRKIFFLLAGLTCFLLAGGSAFAQTATLTATVRPNPLKVQVSAPSSVFVGEWFDITLTVTNLGTEVVKKSTATLHTPAEIVVRGKSKKLANIGPGETKTVSWQAKANSSGNFVILAEVTGNLLGEEISASDTAMISANFVLTKPFRFVFAKRFRI